MPATLKELIERGSRTARDGFSNEKDIVRKFNSWKNDEDAQDWLKIMGYELDKIEKVVAVQINGSHKTDVQVEIHIYFKEGTGIENISIKLVSNARGFNQIDKRWIDKYVELWNIPIEIARILKRFSGEIAPINALNKRDPRREFFDEMLEKERKAVVDFFEKNKILIVADLFRGRDSFMASWFLIYQRDVKVWTLLPMAYVMNFYGNGSVAITPQGSLRIGKIGMQRKGGDNGRNSANMLQFKINPCEIVNHKDE